MNTPTTEQSSPSPAALRAAKEIHSLQQTYYMDAWPEDHEVADIIDREMGVKELVEAAKNALETNGGPIDRTHTGDGHDYVMVRSNAFLSLQSLLAKHEKKE